MAQTKVPEITFTYMDMRNLKFNENNFNGLLCAYSLIHIPTKDVSKTLRNFYRVLKPGGYLEIIAQKGDPDKIVDEPFLPSEKMFFNFFTMEKLSRFLQDANFDVVYQKETDSQDPESMSSQVIYIIAQKPPHQL